MGNSWRFPQKQAPMKTPVPDSAPKELIEQILRASRGEVYGGPPAQAPPALPVSRVVPEVLLRTAGANPGPFCSCHGINITKVTPAPPHCPHCGLESSSIVEGTDAWEGSGPSKPIPTEFATHVWRGTPPGARADVKVMEPPAAGGGGGGGGDGARAASAFDPASGSDYPGSPLPPWLCRSTSTLPISTVASPLAHASPLGYNFAQPPP